MKMLEANKKNWHKKLINALWADQVSSKKSLGLSPFQIVYGVDTIFPLGFLYSKVSPHWTLVQNVVAMPPIKYTLQGGWL